jgi:phenylalanyl-tRNA synthetase beta chain
VHDRPSPAWLAAALESVGQRPINNVVDVTNFLNFEFGQPCHVFDLAKLAGQKLVVRMAARGRGPDDAGRQEADAQVRRGGGR